jgi:hypothetical protein
LAVVPIVRNSPHDLGRDRGHSLYIDPHQGEFAQDAVGAFGLFLTVVGVVVGFSVGKKRK